LANGVGSIQQIPLAQTAEMTYETFLMADFQRAATLYRRQMTEIFVGESGEDFKKRLTTILAESREHLAHKRPSAVVKGSFDGPPSS